MDSGPITREPTLSLCVFGESSMRMYDPVRWPLPPSFFEGNLDLLVDWYIVCPCRVVAHEARAICRGATAGKRA